MNTNCGSDDEFNKRCMENHYCHYSTNWKCNMDELDRRPDCYNMLGNCPEGKFIDSIRVHECETRFFKFKQTFILAK